MDDHGRHIVVELSPEDRPAGVAPRWREWTGEEKHEKVALHYKFPIAIPPGLTNLVPRPRAHRYTTPAQHWRRGALLTDGVGNAALIETELDQKTVTAGGGAGTDSAGFLHEAQDLFRGYGEPVSRLAAAAPGSLCLAWA